MLFDIWSEWSLYVNCQHYLQMFYQIYCILVGPGSAKELVGGIRVCMIRMLGTSYYGELCQTVVTSQKRLPFRAIPHASHQR